MEGRPRRKRGFWTRPRRSRGVDAALEAFWILSGIGIAFAFHLWVGLAIILIAVVLLIDTTRRGERARREREARRKTEVSH